MSRKKGYCYEYDDTQLEAMFAELGDKQRIKALRGAFKKEANVFRKAAINNLRAGVNKTGKTFHSSKGLEQGVRALVFKKSMGFRVTVGTVLKWNKSHTAYSTKKGFHTNSRGEEKPVLIWAEDGTQDRRTRSGRARHQTGRGRRWSYVYRGAYRGRMQRYAFMVKAKDQVMSTVSADLQNEVRNYVVKTAIKHGCTI